MTQNILQTIWTIAIKEMRIHFKTRRLLVIGIIFAAVFIIFSVYGGYFTGSDQDEPSYEEGAESVIILVLGFSSFFPPILAIALTYDSIVGERVNNSMYLLISKPVKKEAIYLHNLLPEIIKTKDSPLREDFLINSGLDRFYIEEMEKEYFQVNSLGEEELQKIRNITA